MKSDYRVRAKRFIRSFIDYVESMDYSIYSTYSMTRAVAGYNHSKTRAVQFQYGCARMALITSDYCVKFDYDAENVCDLGGCEDEYAFYKWLEDDAPIKKYFAEITPYEYNGTIFYIMPRVYNIGNNGELQWLIDKNDFLEIDEMVFDLHRANFGIKNGQPIIIDYAYNILNHEWR